MQAMHTPPDTSAALMLPLPNADDSWTIFDQEIMSLANPSWLYEDGSQFPQPGKSTDGVESEIQPVTYDVGILAANTPNFTPGVAWNQAEQI